MNLCKSTLHTLFIFLSLSKCGTLALANDDDEDVLLDFYGDEETLSIATGTRQPIAKAPAVATVITAKDIQNSGATDIDDVLEMVPGLHVTRSTIGYNPIYSFRGIQSASNPQVLMLINGVPITNLFHGDRNQIWGGMPVNSISRIEVIRGPGSAVYGAEAFAGVINIITKTSEDINGTEFGIRAGSHQTYDSWILHSTDWSGFDVAFMAEFHKTDGADEIITSDAQTAMDQATGSTASLAPGEINLSRENADLRIDISKDYWRLRAGLQRRGDYGNGVGAGQALDPHNRYESNRWNVDLTYHNPNYTDYLDLTVQASFLDTSQKVDENLVVFPPGTITAEGFYPDGIIGNPEVYERHSRFNVSAFYSAIERNQIRMGAGYYYGDLYKVEETKNYGPDPRTGNRLPAGSPLVDVTDTPYVFIKEDDRKNYYLFLQDIWRFADDWELTAGVRYDHYSDFGDTTNPRLALVWSTNVNLTTKLLYGRAFRSPAFIETIAINNPVLLGNPDLNPETLESFELAFSYVPLEQLNIGLNVFYYDWDDIIQFVPDAGQSTSTSQNIGKQKGKGWELEMKWRPDSNTELSANYAYQNSIDKATDRTPPDTPRHQLSLSMNWKPLPTWSLNTQLNWVMDRARNPEDQRSDIDDYRLVNLTLRKKSSDGHWEGAISIRNLFDSDAREPSPWADPQAFIPDDLPLSGRTLFGEIIYQF